MPDPAAEYGCRHCATTACLRGEEARMPTTCPTKTRGDVASDRAPYLAPDVAALMRTADALPFAEGGRLRSRVEELVAFAKARGAGTVGVAYCISMTKEAQALGRILEAAGLRPALASCRVGAIDMAEIGLEKAHPERFTATCNPVAQARLLDGAGAGLIAQMGLCLGHDLLLQEHARAPVTTLVVKDRANDHDPIRPLRPRPAV